MESPKRDSGSGTERYQIGLSQSEQAVEKLRNFSYCHSERSEESNYIKEF
jgi:hypothetical protein